jgi:ubiquinone/menaquinone biosynthesis C-methylase UbiE
VADRSLPRTPHPEYVPFTSDAYVLDPETDVEDATAEWLEIQAEMPFIREVAARTFELMDLRPGDSVLDVGCGTGVMLPALAGAVGPGGQVTGLDRSAGFLARSERRLRDAGLSARVELVRGDALSLPFQDRTFDVTHAERVLMHLDDPDAAIREMARVTRRGGRVVSAEVCASAVEYDQPDRAMLDVLCQTSVAQIRNPSMGIELRRRLLLAGLADVKAAGVIYVETEMDPSEIDEYRRTADALAARGEADPSRAAAAIEHLVATNEAGTYTGIALIFVAVGTVPADGSTS